MTLLLARQCRVLSAPRGAAGAWQRLRCPALAVPAAAPAPARAYHRQNDAAALHEQAPETELPKRITIRKFYAGEKPVSEEPLKKGRSLVSPQYAKQQRLRQNFRKARSHFVTPPPGTGTAADAEAAQHAMSRVWSYF